MKERLVPFIRRRKYLPVGSTGRVCGLSFTVTRRGTREPSGAWRAHVRLDNGRDDIGYFGDEHVFSIPRQGGGVWER